METAAHVRAGAYKPGQVAPPPGQAASEGLAAEKAHPKPPLELIPGEYNLPLIGGALKGLSEPGEAAREGASAAVHPLSSAASAVVEVVSTFGLRLLELIAGGLLILFGLSTLAKGGSQAASA